MPKDKNIRKNTHKFVSFDQLLQKEIKFKKTSKLEVGAECYLKECFDKWNTLNASLEFVELRKSLGPKIMSLELMLHNIEYVIEILLNYIENGTSLSVHTVLDLLQSLVCDIREDIIPYMSRLFSIINKLVNNLKNDVESADLIINSFICIGQIILNIESSIIKDGKVAEFLFLIKPLLFHPKKPYLRKFMAQALAFLIRKIKNFPTFFSTIILDTFVDEHTSNCADAIGKLMSYCLKTEDKLLSSANAMFLSYFDVLYSRDKDVEFLIQCFDEMFKDLLSSLSEEGYRKLWQLMVEKISKQSGDQPQELELLTIELFLKSAQHKKLAMCANIFIMKVKNLVSESPSDKVVEIANLLIGKLPKSQEMMNLVRAVILSKGMSMPKKFEFVKSYISDEEFELTIKNSLSDYLTLSVTQEWLDDSSDNLREVLHSMSDLISTKYPISKRSSWKQQLASFGVNFNFFFLKNDPAPLIKSMVRIVKGEIKCKELFWMTLIILPHLYPANTDEEFVTELKRTIDLLFESELEASSLMDISCIMECVALLTSIQGIESHIAIDTSRILPYISKLTFSSPIEPVILEILSKSISIDSAATKHFQYEQLFVDKLKSPSHQTRLSSIEILRSMHQNDTLAYCQQIEELLELSETEIAKKEKTLYRLLDNLRFSPSMPDLTKKISISYLLGAFHVNFTSLWKYITKTLCTYYPVNKDENKLSKKMANANEVIIWSNISAQLEFCANYLTSDIDKEKMCSDFCCEQQEKYITDKFYSGRSVDWLMYRLNLLKTISQWPEFAGRKSAVLSPLLLSVYNDELHGGSKDHMRTRRDTLITLIYMYARMPNIDHCHKTLECRQLFSTCLTSKNAELQKAAFMALSNYKMPELTAYKDRILQVMEKGHDDLKEISLSDIGSSHRGVVVPIIIRVVLGKMKRVGNGKKLKPLIGYLLQLQGSEMSLLLSLLLEPLRPSGAEVVRIEDIMSGVKNIVKEDLATHGLWSTMQAISGTLNSLLVGLVNKMDDCVLESVLGVVLDMYDCCTIEKNKVNDIENVEMEEDDEMMEEDVENIEEVEDIEEKEDDKMDTDEIQDKMDTYTNQDNQQMDCDDTEKEVVGNNSPMIKHIRQQCAAMVMYFFKKIDQYPWTLASLERVTKSIVDPQKRSLVEDNVASANTTILLSVLWSANDLWINLITEELMSSFVALLTKTKLNRLMVGYKLVHIIYNVMERAVEAGDDRCKAMIVANLGSLIEYLGKRVTAMRPYYKCKIKAEEQQVLFKELRMVTVCVDLVVEQCVNGNNNDTLIDKDTMIQMINNVLVLLYKSNPLKELVLTNEISTDNDTSKETLEVGFLRALDTLVCACNDPSTVAPFLERMLTLLGRLRRRASRSVLSESLEKILTKVPLPGTLWLGKLIQGLNAWDQSHLESLDYDQILATLAQGTEYITSQSVQTLVTSTPTLYANTTMHTSLWIHHTLAQNSLYLVASVPELGPRDAAKNYLEKLIQSLAEANDTVITRNMFTDHMWPVIVTGLSSKDQMVHLAFVSLVDIVLRYIGPLVPRFQDIARLAHVEIEETGFFEGILSLSDYDQTKALRKMVKYLRLNTVSEINLKDIIRPIVFFRLSTIDVQSHTDRQRTAIKVLKNEYSASCLEAVTALARQSGAVLYKKLVEEQMIKLDKGKEVERSISVLVSLLEGYHSDGVREDTDMVDVLKRLEVHLGRKDPSTDRHKKAHKTEDLVTKNNASEWTLQGVSLQVPIARAMVNIAMKMSRKHMKEQVTRVLLRLVGFMRSSDLGVRKTAVNTMVDIIMRLNEEDVVLTKADNEIDGNKKMNKDLHVKFLNFTVHTLKSQLSRGFQRHVGLFACHQIMQKLKANAVFARLPIESSTVTALTEMYLDEQFGEMAKEKMERHDAEKGMVHEAATDKAYEGLRLLAQVIVKSDLVEYIRRLIEAAKTMRTQKSLNKMRTIIDAVKAGLVMNPGLDASSLFALAMVHVNDNLESLFPKAMVATGNTTNVKANRLGTKDMHLYIPPTRLDGYSNTPDQSSKVTMGDNWSFLVVHFGLSLFNTLVKTHKGTKAIDLASVLDPVVDRIIAILSKVTHRETLSLAIKTLRDIVEISPPKLTARVKDVTALLFRLHDTNTWFKDKTETSSALFYKTMTHFLKREDVVISDNQYKVLMLGIDLDSDHKTRMHSIYLLKEIISRRIKEPFSGNQRVILLRQEMDVHLEDLIMKIRPVSLSADSEKGRQEARSALMCYVKHYRATDMEYIKDTLKYYAMNLVAPTEYGPVAACLAIQDLISTYPKVLTHDSKIKIIVVACVAVAMRQGVSAKAEEAMVRIVRQLVMLVGDEKEQEDVAQFVMARVDANDFQCADLGICALIMGASVVGGLRPPMSLAWATKYIDVLCGKVVGLVEYCDTIRDQIQALGGADGDLMADIVTKNEGGDVRGMDEMVEDKMVATRNLGRALVAMGHLLDIDHEDMDLVAIKRHLVSQGMSTGLWTTILTKVSLNYPVNVREAVNTNVMLPLLKYEVDYHHQDQPLFTKDTVAILVDSIFAFLSNKELTTEEANGVLINLIYTLRLILGNIEAPAKAMLLKRMINKANTVAKEELEDNTSIIRRCVVLKFLAGMMAKTSVDDLGKMNLKKNVVWIWMREERQLAMKGKKSSKIMDHLPPKDVAEWTELVTSLGRIIEVTFDQSFNDLKSALNTDRETNKRKRKIDAAALAVSNPCQAITAEKRRKIKK